MVPQLPPGSVVTTPQAGTHYLATEYGIVNLKGKSTREWGLAIVGIAAPQFLDGLTKAAEDMYLI